MNLWTSFSKDRYAKPTDYKLVSSSDTTLTDMPAKQFVVYDYDKDKILGTESTGKVMRILALDNKTGNAYSIKYYAQPSLFNKYLPVAQKMISSFKKGPGSIEENIPVISANNIGSNISPLN